ncbi:MAG: hypothetical protein ACLSCO_17580 [Gallintestinimicrobium sp.]
MELPGLYALGDDGNWLRRRRASAGRARVTICGIGPLTEILDPETGQPVPEGHYGDSWFSTTLRRRGMPLVRHRTGDLGRMIAEPCACGCLVKPRT